MGGHVTSRGAGPFDPLSEGGWQRGGLYSAGPGDDHR